MMPRNSKPQARGHTCCHTATHRRCQPHLQQLSLAAALGLAPRMLQHLHQAKSGAARAERPGLLHRLGQASVQREQRGGGAAHSVLTLRQHLFLGAPIVQTLPPSLPPSLAGHWAAHRHSDCLRCPLRSIPPSLPSSLPPSPSFPPSLPVIPGRWSCAAGGPQPAACESCLWHPR